jgi:hypothetical protein
MMYGVHLSICSHILKRARWSRFQMMVLPLVYFIHVPVFQNRSWSLWHHLFSPFVLDISICFSESLLFQVHPPKHYSSTSSGNLTPWMKTPFLIYSVYIEIYENLTSHTRTSRYIRVWAKAMTPKLGTVYDFLMMSEYVLRQIPWQYMVWWSQKWKNSEEKEFW